MHDRCDSGNGESTQIEEFWWAALAAKLLHPVQVQIIEALRGIDQPLSADDLVKVFNGHPEYWVLIHHVRRLSKLDAIEHAETQTARNALNISYRLVATEPSDGRRRQ